MKELTSKIVNRRSLLSGVALLAGGFALAGCSTAQIATAESSFATVVGQIQSAVAAGLSAAQSYIPTVESILETAAGLFGPTYAAIVTAGSAAFNQVVATLTNVVNVLAPAASSRLAARLRGTSSKSTVLIGVTPALPNSGVSVQVTGWKS